MGIGMAIGVVIMVIGYSFGRAFIYKHTGIRYSQTALSDFAGRSWRYRRYDTLLEM
ncbi:MAG: hypothetical protein KIC77_01515 [Clostridiales bacterium]|nr:hypothetical protein [Clostridiales bacterium]